MIKPTLHLNGTSGERLLTDLIEAADAVRNAIARVRDAAPNARDYYPQGPQAIVVAQKQHFAHVEKLNSVLRDLEELMEHVDKETLPTRPPGVK